MLSREYEQTLIELGGIGPKKEDIRELATAGEQMDLQAI
jgi:hypothetical protein